MPPHCESETASGLERFICCGLFRELDLRGADELHMAQPVLLLRSNNRLVLYHFGLI